MAQPRKLFDKDVVLVNGDPYIDNYPFISTDGPYFEIFQADGNYIFPLTAEEILKFKEKDASKVIEEFFLNLTSKSNVIQLTPEAYRLYFDILDDTSKFLKIWKEYDECEDEEDDDQEEYLQKDEEDDYDDINSHHKPNPYFFKESDNLDEDYDDFGDEIPSDYSFGEYDNY